MALTTEEKAERKAASAKRYYEQNAEKIRAKTKQYYEENKGKALAAQKVYAAKNVGKIAEHAKQYRHKNKERLDANRKKWAKANPDKIRAAQARWDAANPEALKAQQERYNTANPEAGRVKSKAYRARNPEAVAQSRKRHRVANADAISKYNAEYRVLNIDYLRVKSVENCRKRLAADPVFKAQRAVRAAVTAAIKRGGSNKTSKTAEYLGCTSAQAREHIAGLFKPGMSWDNHGLYGWHIDHVRPVASFDHTDPNWPFECNHYTNLQPLWAAENLSKHAKWDSAPTAVCA